VRDIILK